MVESLNEVLLDNGHVMLHAWNPKPVTTRDDQTEAHIIHQLVERAVDGIILRPSSEEFERSYFDEIWQRGIPLILIDREMSMFRTDFVGSDDISIGEEAARYLLELRHERLLFIGSDSRCSTSILRAQGFRNVVSETANAACVQLSSKGALHEMMARADRPTGIFCYAADLVPELEGSLRELSLQVPRDISVIGCGNLAKNENLTSFDQQETEIGRQAAKLYLERVKNRHESYQQQIIRLPASLIVRGTTAPITR